MDPLRFLALARRLAASANEEEWRSAISRAYYAAFHVACGLMSDLGFTVPSADRAHAFLWLRLQNCGDTATEKAGSELKTLRSWRNGADYDLKRPVSRPKATTAVSLAEMIIQALNAAALAPLRTQITTAMQLYEQNVLHDVTWHP